MYINPIRSTRPEVRNPVLALPEAVELARLLATCPPEVQRAADTLLHALSRRCREAGNKAWNTHKPPMAAYWKAWAVNWRHLKLALRAFNQGGKPDV